MSGFLMGMFIIIFIVGSCRAATDELSIGTSILQSVILSLCFCGMMIIIS